MSKIWTIVRHEIYVTIRRRAYLLTTFGVPVLAAAVVAFFVLTKEKDPNDTPTELFKWPDEPIGYVDHSGVLQPPDEWIPRLVGILETQLETLPQSSAEVEAARDSLNQLTSELKAISEHIIPYEEEDQAIADVRAGKLDSVYLVAADYMETGNVTRKAAQFEMSAIEQNPFESYLFLQLLSQNPEDFGRLSALIYRINVGARVIEHQLDENGVEQVQVDRQDDTNFILVYGFGMIWLVSTFVSSGYLLQSIVQEKENRMIEVALSSLRPLQLLAGKVFGQGAMGLFQVVVWLTSGWLLFNLASIELPGLGGASVPLYKIALALVYFIAGFLLFATIYAGIGAVSSNLREGPQYASFFTLPALAPMFFLTLFIESPNATLPVALSLIPFTAPLSMVQRVAITAVPLWQLGLSLLSIALGFAATLWFAAKLFRVNTLLAGSPPKIGEIVKLLKET